MLVYPKYGLQIDTNIPEFRISCFVMAEGYMVQPCWFIRGHLAILYKKRAVVTEYYIVFWQSQSGQ